MPKHEKVVIDADIADALRTAMDLAATEWGGVLIIPAGVSRAERLIARAYGQVFDVEIRDANDEVAGEQLSPRELRRLPRLRATIRYFHPHEGVEQNLLEDLIDLLMFRVQPLWLNAFTLVVLMQFPALIGVGAYEAWRDRSISPPDSSSIWFLGLLVAVCFGGFLEMAKDYKPVSTRPSQPSEGIENFREKSAFGDASLAQKQAIARAMMGQQLAGAPVFED
jgi:hypothetical protein